MNTLLQTFLIDQQLEFWLGEINASWSVRQLRARVLRVVQETHDVKTFVLRANHLWRRHRPGQFVPVEVEINGARTRRCYSISSAPGGRIFAITVKRTGRVSTYLHDHVRPGDVLHLGQPAGSFVLPTPAPSKTLLVSGGSGITPLMSMLRDLANRGALSDVVFMHAARSEADVIFGAELLALAKRHAGLRLMFHYGPLDQATLTQSVPDFADRETFLCGPQGMMDSLAPLWKGIEHRLMTERFSAAPLAASTNETNETNEKVRLTLATSEKSFETNGAGTLLEQLERAGETPKYGCRMGICNTCLCRKKAGVVEDLRTGALSAEPDQDIRLCVSAARSDLTLAL